MDCSFVDALAEVPALYAAYVAVVVCVLLLHVLATLGTHARVTRELYRLFTAVPLVVITFAVALSAYWAAGSTRRDALVQRSDIRSALVGDSILLEVPLKLGGSEEHLWAADARPWLAVRENAPDSLLPPDSLLSDTRKVGGDFVATLQRGVFLLPDSLLGRELLITPHVEAVSGEPRSPFVNALPNYVLANPKLSAWRMRFTRLGTYGVAVRPWPESGWAPLDSEDLHLWARSTRLGLVHLGPILLAALVALLGYWLVKRVYARRGASERSQELKGALMRDVFGALILALVAFVCAEHVFHKTFQEEALAQARPIAYRVGKNIALEVPVIPRRGEDGVWRSAKAPILGVTSEGSIRTNIVGWFTVESRKRALFMLPESLMAKPLVLKPQIEDTLAGHAHVFYADCSTVPELYARSGEDELAWRARLVEPTRSTVFVTRW